MKSRETPPTKGLVGVATHGLLAIFISLMVFGVLVDPVSKNGFQRGHIGQDLLEVLGTAGRIGKTLCEEHVIGKPVVNGSGYAGTEQSGYSWVHDSEVWKVVGIGLLGGIFFGGLRILLSLYFLR